MKNWKKPYWAHLLIETATARRIIPRMVENYFYKPEHVLIFRAARRLAVGAGRATRGGKDLPELARKEDNGGRLPF